MLNRVALAVLVGACISLAAPRPAQAAFHLWVIEEVFSNADGSIQYIELSTTSGGQTVLAAHTLTATSDGVTVTFTIPSNLSGNTANQHLLFATPGFANLPGSVTPDYVLPCGPFFDPNASSITIDFASVDSISFNAAQLPTDGTSALVDQDLGPGQILVEMTSSPRNYAGTTGAMSLGGCLSSGACDACEDALFCNGVEQCSGTMCVPGVACMDICDEANDTCVECVTPADCDDSNACTDDACTAGTCQNTNNTAPCDDGLFCTLTDACASGSCQGTGDTCLGENCNEGTDACGDCFSQSDCEDGSPCTIDDCTAGDCVAVDAEDGTECDEDGAFCNGVEACSAGVCASPGDPCDPRTESCEEDSGACESLCGNGLLDAGEECDDADEVNGDGCTSSCTIEPGFDCDVSVEPSVCTEATGEGGGGPQPGVGGSAPVGGSGQGGSGSGTTLPGEEEGCGCSTAPDHGNAGRLSLALAALAVLMRRRLAQRTASPQRGASGF